MKVSRNYFRYARSAENLNEIHDLESRRYCMGGSDEHNSERVNAGRLELTLIMQTNSLNIQGYRPYGGLCKAFVRALKMHGKKLLHGSGI